MQNLLKNKGKYDRHDMMDSNILRLIVRALYAALNPIECNICLCRHQHVCTSIVSNTWYAISHPINLGAINIAITYT